jgi:putative tryptophan/tyrosine transport system substrate-binding protein
MRRREFIALLGGAAAGWPLAAHAQQPTIPVIGFMSARSPEDSEYVLAAFQRGLEEGGFIDGRNVKIEYLWARGDYNRLPAFAAEFVGRQVNVLVATGGDVSAHAAKSATSAIPIVFSTGGDPAGRQRNWGYRFEHWGHGVKAARFDARDCARRSPFRRAHQSEFSARGNSGSRS